MTKQSEAEPTLPVFSWTFGRCPHCDSREWRYFEKDEEGVNLTVQCLGCGIVRGRQIKEMLQ